MLSCRLVRLDLGFCGRGFGTKAADAFASAGPFMHLKELCLSGAYRLQPASVLHVASATPQLKALCLPDCSWLLSSTVAEVVGRLQQLTRLDLARCGGVDAEGLAAGLSSLPDLAYLSLGMPLLIAFMCVWLLVPHAPCLRTQGYAAF
jgi:hypothetical protein